MTFTRTIDSETLTPRRVFGPYENERELRTSVVPLAESSNVRVVYNFVGLRTGTLMLLLDSYADAVAGAEFFAVASSFNFDGPIVNGGYHIEDGLIVYDGEIDDTFDMRFVVGPDGARMRIRQNLHKYELHVPFHELVEGS